MSTIAPWHCWCLTLECPTGNALKASVNDFQDLRPVVYLKHGLDAGKHTHYTLADVYTYTWMYSHMHTNTTQAYPHTCANAFYFLPCYCLNLFKCSQKKTRTWYQKHCAQYQKKKKKNEAGLKCKAKKRHWTEALSTEQHWLDTITSYHIIPDLGLIKCTPCLLKMNFIQSMNH